MLFLATVLDVRGSWENFHQYSTATEEELFAATVLLLLYICYIQIYTLVEYLSAADSSHGNDLRVDLRQIRQKNCGSHIQPQSCGCI